VDETGSHAGLQDLRRGGDEGLGGTEPYCATRTLGPELRIDAQALEYVLVYQGQFNEPEQYRNIIIRANEEGEHDQDA
jgi:hypothetical protein